MAQKVDLSALDPEAMQALIAQLALHGITPSGVAAPKEEPQRTVYVVETGEARKLFRIHAAEQLRRGLVAATPEEAERLRKAVKAEEPKRAAVAVKRPPVGRILAARLVDAGLGSPEKVLEVGKDALLAIDGVDDEKADAIVAWAAESVESTGGE